MKPSYKQQAIKELAKQIKKSGFRVFIADSGTYGFYTDETGAKLVSFQVDLGIFSFNGEYKTSNPKQTGAGWRITDEQDPDFSAVFNSYPPHWAVRDANWRYTTLDEHLAAYNSSSSYKEV